jgi:hypothetical protein
MFTSNCSLNKRFIGRIVDNELKNCDALLETVFRHRITHCASKCKISMAN